MLSSLLRARLAPWLILGAIAILSAVYLFAYSRGHNAGEDDVQAQWDADKLERAQQYIAEQERYTAVTQQIKRDAQALAQSDRERLNAQEQAYEARISDIASGELRLRKQWQQCSATLSAATAATAATGTASRDDDPAQNGFPEALSRPFLRIGLDADKQGEALKTCQGQVQLWEDWYERVRNATEFK